MAKKIRRVHTDKMKELSGFEEVFDLFESTEIREGSIDPRSGDDTFQLYNFLENEKIRHLFSYNSLFAAWLCAQRSSKQPSIFNLRN